MYRTLLPTLALPLAAAACTSMSSTDTSSTSDTRATPTVTAHPKPTEAAPARAFPYAVHRAKLDNGLFVITVPMPADGLVSYWSVVRTGSRDEVEPGVTGFAHFFEHMMFRGTERYPGKEYDRIVNGMGASANAFTTDDFTAYHLSFSKEDLPKVVEIEADRFQNLKYPEQLFTTEAGAVMGEYRKGRTSPFQVLFEAIQDTAFEKHTYKHTTIGFLADIERMPQQYEYSKGFFQRFYRPENVVLLVTGDVDPARVVELAKKEYGGWKKGYQAPDVPVEPPQTKQKRVDVPYEHPTLPILTINFKGEAYHPGDATMVAATLIGELAFGETAPVYRKLVLDEQRVEALGASFDLNRDPGLWTIYAMVKDAADVPAVEKELWTAIDALRTTPVADERLAAVRSREKYGFLSGLTTPDEVARALARVIALTGDVAAVDTYFATLAKVTPADVQKAARTWLVPERSTVAVLHTQGQEIPWTKDERSAAGGPGGSGVLAAEAAVARQQPAVSQPPVLLPVPQSPTVALRTWVQVGSQDDPPGKEGLAALTAALVTEGGTKSRPYEGVLEALFPLAAGYGGSVDREMTVITGEVHREKLAEYLPLYVEAIVAPGFREEDFERLRSNAISYIENSLRSSSDEELAKAALYAEVFEGTPYAHIDTGTVASLRGITLDDVRAFHAKNWTRDNVVIGLGGSYPDGAPAQLAKDLGALPAGKPARTPKPAPPAIEGREVVLVEKKGPGVSISFGHPIDVARGSREYYALWIANSWLGEHRNSSSHLYQVIREARGLNYGDYSYVEAYPNGGRRTKPPTGVGRRAQLFEVWLRTLSPDNAPFALRAALREVDRLVEQGLSKEEFERTRRFLKGYALHFAESLPEKLGYAVDDRYYGIENHLATFRKRMDEITHEEVNAAIKKHLSTKDLVIAMVVPDAEKMKAILTSDAPTPVTYPPDATKPPEILAEDKVIEAYPFGVDPAKVEIVPVGEMFEASGRTSG